jgi:hypothetical protein
MRTLLLLLASLMLTLGAQPTSAAFDDECYLWQSLDTENSDLLDKYLLELDASNNVAIMAQGHVDLMRQAGGAINFCEIERRLRKLNAKTFLLALPLEAILPPHLVDEYTITYPFQIFMSWSPAPRYSTWYELHGPERAAKKMEESGMNAEANRRNLNSTGVITGAKEVHPKYVRITSAIDYSSLNSKYKGLYEVLAEYHAAGHLSSRHNSRLMYIIDAFIDALPVKGYTINAPPSADHLQLYVVDKDPKRILGGLRCNCGFVPDTNLVICDKAILDALETWFSLSKQEESLRKQQRSDIPTEFVPGAFAIIDDAFADFLLHWVVGHEIGHFKLKHSYSSLFMSFDNQPIEVRDPAGQVLVPPKPIKTMEAEADAFAFSGMPERAKGMGHQVIVQLIKQIARNAGIGPDPLPDGTSKVQIFEPHVGHPNLMSRAYTFVQTIGTEDFFIDKLRKNFDVAFEGGFRVNNVCALSKR